MRCFRLQSSSSSWRLAPAQPGCSLVTLPPDVHAMAHHSMHVSRDIAHGKASRMQGGDIGACCLLAGAGTNDGRWAAPTCKPPTAKQLLSRYPGLETQFSYPINTASPTAQRLFDLVRQPSHMLFVLWKAAVTFAQAADLQGLWHYMQCHLGLLAQGERLLHDCIGFEAVDYMA